MEAGERAWGGRHRQIVWHFKSLAGDVRHDVVRNKELLGSFVGCVD